jgi:hypothetical protein
MKRNLFTVLLIACVLAGACAMYKATLRTETAGAIDPAGAYSVIKYGANYADDYSTFAIIVPENGKYSFDIFKPDFEYRVVRGLSAKQALEAAQVFVRGPEVMRSQVNGIIAPDGSVIGYEVRPLYNSHIFGISDVLLVGYFLKDGNRVEVRIDVEDVVKNRNRGDDAGGN